MQNSYDQLETKVLKKIYDLSGQNSAKPVFTHQLESELGLGCHKVTGFCKGLNEQGLINWPPDVEAYLYITRAGIDAIQSLGKPKPPSGGDTYNTHIGTIHGAAQIGSGNVQNVQMSVTNNPEFDQAISRLLQVVQASGLPSDELEELNDEVIKLNKLALSEPKADSLEKAKFRIDKAKLSFEAAKLLAQAAPHLHTAWEYFKVHFG